MTGKTVKPAEKTEQPPQPPVDKTVKPAEKTVRYSVYCKGVGSWEYLGTDVGQSEQAKAAFMAHFGIIATDQMIVVNEESDSGV